MRSAAFRPRRVAKGRGGGRANPPTVSGIYFRISQEQMMETRIKRWEDGLGLRIPQPIADLTGIREDSVVELAVEDRSLVIRPVRRRWPRLEDLLEQTTDESQHEEVDTGPPQGVEEW
jgi:antitoxin MazE